MIFDECLPKKDLGTEGGVPVPRRIWIMNPGEVMIFRLVSIGKKKII